eukprot:Colp12_sorted_trinity150504_noHs@23139
MDTGAALNHFAAELRRLGVSIISSTTDSNEEADFKVVDVHSNKSLLDSKIADEEETCLFEISGGTDGVIVPRHTHVFFQFSLFLAVEYKLEHQFTSSKSRSQTIAELLSATELSNYPVLVVLTDFRSQWTVFRRSGKFIKVLEGRPEVAMAHIAKFLKDAAPSARDPADERI